MQSNLLVHKTGKIGVIANYHNPDVNHEKISSCTVRCGAIVEICREKLSPFTLRTWFNVDPIFGKILWHQICVSDNFCVNLTSWLFHQWREVEESDGKGNS